MLVVKKERKQSDGRSNAWTDTTDCITFPAITVGNMHLKYAAPNLQCEALALQYSAIGLGQRIRGAAWQLIKFYVLLRDREQCRDYGL